MQPQPSSFLLTCASFKISPCVFRSLLSILPQYTNSSTWSRFSLFIIICYCLCHFPAKYKYLGLWYINANIQSHTLCCIQSIPANHLGSQLIARHHLPTKVHIRSFYLFISCLYVPSQITSNVTRGITDTFIYKYIKHPTEHHTTLSYSLLNTEPLIKHSTLMLAYHSHYYSGINLQCYIHANGSKIQAYSLYLILSLNEQACNRLSHIYTFLNEPHWNILITSYSIKLLVKAQTWGTSQNIFMFNYLCMSKMWLHFSVLKR